MPRLLPRPALLLASASPRRHALLRSIVSAFDVFEPEIDEAALAAGLAPVAAVCRLAEAKALLPDTEQVILAADTVVLHRDRIFSKPLDPADAAAMLRLMAGRTIEVLTGVAVRKDSRVRTEVVSTAVTLRPLTERQIAEYLATGEADDKAGALSIQGAAASFVARGHGSYSNVLGLPLEVVAGLLRDAGIPAMAPPARPLEWTGPAIGGDG